MARIKERGGVVGSENARGPEAAEKGSASGEGGRAFSPRKSAVGGKAEKTVDGLWTDWRLFFWFVPGFESLTGDVQAVIQGSSLLVARAGNVRRTAWIRAFDWREDAAIPRPCLFSQSVTGS